MGTQGVMPAHLKVAFVGDTDSEEVEKLYELIRNEGNVTAVVLNGDLDYKQEHQEWRKRFERILGATPYFTTAGNHDTWTWTDYQAQTKQHYTLSNTTQCSGTVGVREVCTHQGLGLLLSGAGSGCGGLQPSHTHFFHETLQSFEDHDVIFRICLFHKPQRNMQVGSKKDAVGWDKYEACLKHGAMVFTSHEHLYGRTHQLSEIGAAFVNVTKRVPKGSSASNPIEVGSGKTFVVLNGMGGKSIRRFDADLATNPWWAATWGDKGDTARSLIAQDVANFKDGADPTYGVFFCEYHVQGNPRLARCYMKDVLGRLVDEFYVRSTN